MQNIYFKTTFLSLILVSNIKIIKTNIIRTNKYFKEIL